MKQPERIELMLKQVLQNQICIACIATSAAEGSRVMVEFNKREVMENTKKLLDRLSCLEP